MFCACLILLNQALQNKDTNLFLNLSSVDENLYAQLQGEEVYMMYGISYAILVDSGHVISNQMPDSMMLALLLGSQVLTNSRYLEEREHFCKLKCRM